MSAWRLLLPALLLVLVAAIGRADELPLTLKGPDDPGPNRPPAGRSMFDELYGDGRSGHSLPFPFETLLADLERRVGSGTVTTALIPLGRSLQRHAAWPDYFSAPRIVAAVTADPEASGRSLLEDRFYIGYHEKAGVIEVISWNEAAGRFEFQVVEDYRAGEVPRVEDGERSVCVACHQSHGPIFATALWSETNANVAVRALLAPLGNGYHGVPVAGSVDHTDAFDRSTDRAFDLALTDWLWRVGCGDGPVGIRCRKVLLGEALSFRLRGGLLPRRPPPEAAGAVQRLDTRLEELAPHGLAAPSPDLPNRDPMRLIANGADPFDAVEPEGPFDPSTPRLAVLLWQPDDAEASFEQAVRAVAAAFSTADIRRLDGVLRARTLTEARRIEVTCSVASAAGPRGREELRFAYARGVNGGLIALEGYVQIDDSSVIGGRIRTLELDSEGRAPPLEVTGGHFAEGRLHLEVAQSTGGLAPRLTGGGAIVSLTLDLEPQGQASAAIGLADDLAPLDRALDRMAVAAGDDLAAALSPGPLWRRLILGELDAALEATP